MILSAQQVATVLRAEGMPSNRVAEFVAIAHCESGFNTGAISPAGALGLWQIMPFNFAPLGLDVNFWDVDYTNARAAVLLSGYGSNCAAWDTCYANIYRSGRYRYLNWPEVGSCASNYMAGYGAQLGLGNSGNTSAPAYPGTTNTAQGAVAHMDHITNHVLPYYRSQGYLMARRVRALYR